MSANCTITMFFVVVFEIALFVFVVFGQDDFNSTLVLENESGIIEQVRSIISEFSQLQINNLNSAVSSTTNFLLSSGIKIFSVFDPLILGEIISKGIESRASCEVCLLVTGILSSDMFSINVLNYAAMVICKIFKIQRPIICEQMIDTYRDMMTFIKYNSKLTSEEICGVLLGDFCVGVLTDKVFWYMNLTSKLKPLPFRRGLRRLILKPQKRKSNKLIKFIQISDIHPDPKYEAGANKFCGDPICCRKYNGFPNDKKLSAGSWGTYSCDPPTNITSDALRQIYHTHPDASFWLWTGDNVHHEPYNTSKEEVKKLLTITTDQFLPYLNSGIKIYPSLGNHDIIPLNSFAPPEVADDGVSTRWLYEYAADLWSPFLPESALKTFRKTGSYIVRHSDNLVIVNLNSNYCYRLNFWTYYNSVDPGGQLVWLERTLALAESMNDHVFLVMHVPPDRKECTQGWLHNYMLIIERYSHIIKGQFSGHTHFDDMRIYYSLYDGFHPDAIGVLFLVPSITPYSGGNPSYRVYFMKESTSELINYHTYTADLNEANRDGQGVFKFSYDAKSFWNIKSISGLDMDKAVTEMITNDTLFSHFFHQVFTSKSKFEDFNKVFEDEDFRTRKLNQLNLMRVADPYYWQPKSLILEEVTTRRQAKKTKP